MKMVKEHLKKFSKFCTVGLINTIIDFFVFYILSMRIDATLARSVSYLVAATHSFIVNRKWTFNLKNRRKKSELIRFIFTCIFVFTINMLLFKLCHGILCLNKIVCYIISTAASAGINYLLSMYWVFR